MTIFRKLTWCSLKNNRARTIITVLGIILSTTMLTAVTTSLSSFQNYMLRIVENQSGSWESVIGNLSEKEMETVTSREEVETYGVIKNIGYAKLKKAFQKNRPYIYVGAYEGDALNLCSAKLVSGRLPENSSEILVPESLSELEGDTYALGSTVTLSLGKRYSAESDSIIWQENSYLSDDEEWTADTDRTYQIVGIYAGGRFNQDWQAGYTVLTQSDTADSMVVYMKLNNPISLSSFNETLMGEVQGQTGNLLFTDENRDYLLYSGHSESKTANTMIFGMVAILMGIIMIGSISLIGNSFSICINERKRELGILSSIGATKKQLRHSVVFEALLLSIVGIPAGILIGIGGMTVTFRALSGIFERFASEENITEPISLTVSVSAFSVLLAIAVGLVTVLLSAWLPVKKALKLSAIETIRQSDDIRIRSKQIKTSKLTQKLFGLEGTLASKNFKRNRRKYRATVFSLCLSIVLFISASSFCDYLNYSIKQFVETYDCDILYQSDNITEDTWFETFKNQSGITKAACIYELYDGELLADDSFLTEQAKSDSQSKTGNKSTVFAKMIFVDDDSYAAYLLEHGYDKSVYMDVKNPTAIAVDTVSYITDDNKAGSYRAFAKENGDVTYAASYGGEYDADEQVSVHIGAVEEDLPYGAQMLKGSVLLFYPKSAMKMLSDTDVLQLEMAFSSDNPDRTYNRMQLVMQSEDTLTGILNNIDSQIQTSKGLMTVIQVFSYGFIVLISLIAMMNVFNTISTNIALRRREFAMLRSVGMTQRGFFKMMNYECFMYGTKGILFGLPIALIVTYLIYHTVSNGLDMKFYVPWHSVVIAVGSVFLVVFVTMIYAMNGIRKDNVIETLKNENY